MGASWGHLGGLLGVFVGGPLGASWGLLVSILGLLGGLLGPPGGLSGGRLELSVRVPPLGAVLGLSWAVLGASWAVLGPSWTVLGPSWGPLGPSWGALRGSWSSLGWSEARKGDNMTYIEKHNGNQRFLHIGALVRVLLERSRGFFKPSWAVLQVRLGSHLGRLGRLGERKGRVWWPTDARKEGAMRARGRDRGGGGPLEDYRNLARQHLAF